MPADTDQPTLAVTSQGQADARAYIMARCAATDQRSITVSKALLEIACADTRPNAEPRPAGDLREAQRICRETADRATHMLDREDRRWQPTRAHYEGLRNALRNAEKEVAAALATHSPAPMSGWRDMDDAPKDGSQILAWFWSALVTGNSYGWADTIRWWNGMWWDDRDGPCEPVAWMPRPAPPAAAHPSTQEG